MVPFGDNQPPETLDLATFTHTPYIEQPLPRGSVPDQTSGGHFSHRELAGREMLLYTEFEGVRSTAHTDQQ